ncbi:MobA/MobL family protein, partial [Escherichia coli]|nr:MobA/MobL family protein [Escherichia coli]
FNEDGTWWKNKSKKEYILDEDGNNVLDKNGKKKTRKVDLTGWNSKEKLLEWREKYAEKINEYYRLKGIKKSVSHLSYEAQG